MCRFLFKIRKTPLFFIKGVMNIMEIYLYIWLAAFVLFAAVEFVTSMALISIWFAVGSLAALILSAFDVPLWIQLLVFILVSAILLICTRPIAKKLNKNNIDTNLEINIGKTAKVIEDINNSKATGRVRLKGVDWSAVSETGELIEKDSHVTVTRIEGSKLYVKK